MRPRVLLVPDTPFWITGDIAREIARHNPGLDCTVLPSKGLKWLAARHPELLREFDLVHCLTPDLYRKFAPRFGPDVARVTTVFHVEDDADTDGAASCDAVMTASLQWRDALRRAGVPPEKLFVVPLGVDVERFRPPGPAERARLRAAFGLAEDRVAVGFCAKRSSDVGGRKGVDVFLAALERLAQPGRPVVAFAIGPGWAEFAAERSRPGLEFRCFPFLVDRDELARVYRVLDVFWVTSRVEGGPAPLLEAMATGLSCLTTPVGVAEEVVRDGENGALCAQGDAEAFAERSAALAADPARRERWGTAARDTVLAERRWSRCAPAAGRLVETLLAARPAVSRPRAGAGVWQRVARRVDALEYDGFARSLEKMGELESAERFARGALRRMPARPDLWRRWARMAWRARSAPATPR